MRKYATLGFGRVFPIFYVDEEQMNKTVMGLVAALVVAAGAGFGAYTFMQDKQEDSANSSSATSAGDTAAMNDQSAAATEPAADDKAKTDDAEPAKSEPTDAVVASADNPVVAKVDGKDVLRSDVLSFMEALPPQMKQLPPKAIFPMVLEQVVNGKIVDERVAKTDLANDPEVAKRMEMAKAQILRAVYAEKQIDENFKDSDVKDAYDKLVKDTPKVEEAKASHILVEDEATAKEIIGKLDSGAKFADLAKEYSKDKSNASNGGDLGYFAEGDMVKEFSDAAFALKKGEYTKSPVKTQFGYHIIMLEDKRDRPAPKFEEVKGQLEGQVKRDLLNKLVDDWRKGAQVETFDFDGKPLPAKKDDASGDKAAE